MSIAPVTNLSTSGAPVVAPQPIEPRIAQPQPKPVADNHDDKPRASTPVGVGGKIDIDA